MNFGTLIAVRRLFPGLSCLFLFCVNAVAADQVLKWDSLPELPGLNEGVDNPGVAGPFVGVHNDALIIAGGANFPNKPLWETGKVWHDKIYVLVKNGAAYQWKDGGKLSRPLAYGASVSTSEGVLCMGGDDAEKVYRDVFLLSWNKEAEKVERRDFPPLPVPVAYGAAALVKDVVYLVGGQQGKKLASATNSVWSLDLKRHAELQEGGLFRAEGEWQAVVDVPWSARAFVQVAAQHNGFDDCIYVIGGRREQGGEVELISDVWEYNTRSKSWRARAAVDKPLMAGTAIGYGQSHVAVLGGSDGALWGKADELKDDHPGFPKKAYFYHTITDTWIEAGSSPANHVTTVPVRWGDSIIIASGEVRPRVRSPKIWKVTPQPRSKDFGTVNYIVLGLYLLLMVGVGVYFARRSKGTDDFFRGGKRMVWWAAGCSIFATMLSSLTFTGLPSKAYAQNWVYFIANMTIPVVAFVAVYVALPFYRRIDATSAYEYLEKRFSPPVRMLGSGFFTLFHVFRMAVVMSLTGLALAAATPLSPGWSVVLMGFLSILYCTMGGISAVIWTDTIQTVVLLGGAVIAFFLLIAGVDGGFEGFMTKAGEADKFRMANFNWDIASTQVAIWVIILGALAQNVSGYTADQAVVQRYMTTPDRKMAARSIWTNAVLSVVASILFFGLGSALFAFYQSNPSSLDPTMTTDQVFPLFIAREMPVGLAGLIVAGIFAAAQSTVSTSMNSTATTLVTDFLKPMNYHDPEGDDSDLKYLKTARKLTVVMGVLGTAFGLVFINPDIKSLFDEFIKIVGLIMGMLGGLFLLGVLSRRANATGALIGCAGGVAVVFWVWKGTEVAAYFYPFVSVSSCFVIGLIASYIFSGRGDTEGLTVHALRRQGQDFPGN
ncbi:MAG: sodium/solute symporter [Verrucomicrobiaceae bacterium]|nr:sodium/solute symporter [Verrucomicrobiaceae bacterium]